MVNLPIYRAKKIDSDEWVDGYYAPMLWIEGLGHCEDVMVSNYIYNTYNLVDPSTLAIHFPNTNKWYSIEEMQEIIKRHEDGNMEAN